MSLSRLVVHLCVLGTVEECWVPLTGKLLPQLWFNPHIRILDTKCYEATKGTCDYPKALVKSHTLPQFVFGIEIG